MTPSSSPGATHAELETWCRELLSLGDDPDLPREAIIASLVEAGPAGIVKLAEAYLQTTSPDGALAQSIWWALRELGGDAFPAALTLTGRLGRGPPLSLYPLRSVQCLQLREAMGPDPSDWDLWLLVDGGADGARLVRPEIERAFQPELRTGPEHASRVLACIRLVEKLGAEEGADFKPALLEMAGEAGALAGDALTAVLSLSEPGDTDLPRIVNAALGQADLQPALARLQMTSLFDGQALLLFGWGSDALDRGVRPDMVREKIRAELPPPLRT